MVLLNVKTYEEKGRKENVNKNFIVIHAAAQRFPDKMEKEFEKSWNLNVTATQTISEVTAEVG